jgi:hypothetical protein
MAQIIPTIAILGRECSLGRLMNIVDIDMNVYGHPKRGA